VRVLDEEGNQLGVLATPEALRQAQERGLDLVEIAPTSAPPVCKYLDYGKFKYEAQKKEQDARKRQKTADLKELRCTPKIGDADLQTKIRQAHKFLSGGDRVKFSVKFRGREMTHPEIGAPMSRPYQPSKGSNHAKDEDAQGRAEAHRVQRFREADPREVVAWPPP